MYNFAYSYFQIININLSDFILQLHFFSLYLHTDLNLSQFRYPSRAKRRTKFKHLNKYDKQKNLPV